MFSRYEIEIRRLFYATFFKQKLRLCSHSIFIAQNASHCHRGC